MYYIGYSNDQNIRYKASSGGIGTTFLKYMLSLHDYDTAITFYFDPKSCQYKPRLIYNIEDLNICGSIYQDIDLVSFIRQNIDDIRNGIVITCLPCQVRPLRSIFNRHNIKNFIMTFVCSGQTTIEGTYCYYRLLHINKKDIRLVQYRGNGWPSGIQIKLNNGRCVYKDNYSYPWTLIQSSKLYRPKKCFFCKKDTDYSADISLADPWLKEYKQSDQIGHTMFSVNTDSGAFYLEELLREDLISIKSSLRADYEIAQRPNVDKGKIISQNLSFLLIVEKICSIEFYRHFFSMNVHTIKLHLKILNLIKHIYK